jgi:ribosomal-protein-alanine N-acetyltransferase
MKTPVAMQAHHLPDVLRVEQSAYSHPWTHGNFIDSIASGYHLPLWLEQDQIAAYLVAMRGVDEVHLLNLTVAPDFQRQGWARMLLQHLRDWSIERGAHNLWLEVRASNLRALQVYQAHGFTTEGLRRDYYPVHMGRREDAVVMSLQW